MAWNDRIIEARYTSPSGSSFTFAYEDLKKKTSLKTATFLFPEKDGAYLQSLGRAGRNFPMACIFHGPDCMEEASAFERALEERGVGELQHPIYGTFKVVPTGELDRADNLVSGANQTVIDVVFAETILPDNSLTSSILKEDKISASLDRFSDAASGEFDRLITIDNVSDAIDLQSTLNGQTALVEDNLTDLAKKDPKTYTNFLAIAKEMPDTINNVGRNKLAVAKKSYNMIMMPSKIVTDTSSKIKSYARMVTAFTNTYTKDPLGLNNIKNQYASTKFCLYTALSAVSSGLAVSSLKTGSKAAGAAFSSRQQAVAAAARVRVMFDQVQEFVDIKNSKDLFVDAGGGYEAMLEVVKESLDIIINSSFQLPVRRVISLDQDRQIMELMTELYGNLDHIDEFIIENKLTADEIEILPRGKKVVYYAEIA